MKDKHNLTAHLAISEALSRELPIDPELRDLILITDDLHQRYNRFWLSIDEDSAEADVLELVDRAGCNLLHVLEDLTGIMHARLVETFTQTLR